MYLATHKFEKYNFYTNSKENTPKAKLGSVRKSDSKILRNR